MRFARPLLPLSLAMLTLPSGAAAELPMLIALDGRTDGEIARMLDGVGYPAESRSYVTSALVGALFEEPLPTHVERYYRGEGVPFVVASSRTAGACQFAELTAWFPDGSRPPIRLNGRYCVRRSDSAILFRASRQRLRLLPEEETPPSPPPGTPPQPGLD